ncbi:MAG TPA: OmpA family protein [Burkholderiaceae bacterium]|nr:OmpA family protein [Burkholderiaceae bacterium]
MLDEQDQGTRIGVGVALGVVLLLVVGLLGWLTMRGAARAPVPAAAAAAAESYLDVPLAGELAGTLFFAVGLAELPADTPAVVDKVKQALAAAPARKAVLSGFHDASGDAATNAELAKNRAKAVRDALRTAGVDAARIALRKPESTLGDGSRQEARRVEIRLVD